MSKQNMLDQLDAMEARLTRMHDEIDAYPEETIEAYSQLFAAVWRLKRHLRVQSPLASGNPRPA
jgi:hypothetical protein